MKFRSLLKHVTVVIFAIIWFIPIAILFITVLKSGSQFYELSFWALPPLTEIPKNIFQNFKTAITAGELLRPLFDTFLYAGVSSLGAALVSALAAYALVHLDIRYPQAWFLTIFGGNLLPFQMFLLPIYIAFSSIGLYNTRLGLTIVYFGLCIPFGLFLYRNYASQIPVSFFDAAKIDGANSLQIFWRIFFPMTKSAFLSVFVIQFIWGWNNLLFGMVLTEDVRPIMAMVAKMSPTRGFAGTPAILAGSFLASIPTIVIFIILHRQFIEGLTITR